MASMTIIPIAEPKLPTMSPALRGWLLDDFDMEWVQIAKESPLIKLPRYRDTSASVRAEAARLLPAYRAASKPPSCIFLCEWLQPLAVVVRNPVSVHSLEHLSLIFAEALSTVPVGAFSRDAWVRMMQTFKFWPSPADIAELLQDDANDIRRAVEVLAFIAEGGA